MKKIVISFFTLLTLVFIGNISNAASDFTLEEINFDASINADGSMNVIETWYIDVHSMTNTLFKTFNLDNSKYSGITDVKVYEIDNSGKEIQFKEKNEEVLHVDKNCYYGLVNSKGKYEIAWGINEKSGEKIYKVSYKVNDCIKKYNDISELYWQFIGKDFDVDIDKIIGTIHIPSIGADKSSIKAWAHGPLNGNIIINSAEQVSFELQYFDSGNFVEVRLAMPNDIFTGIESVLKTNRLDTILTEETYWADEANAAREEIIARKEKKEKNIETIKNIMQIIGVVLTLVFLTRINKYEKIIKENPKLKPEMPSKYYRDIPNEDATPAEAAFLYYYNSNGIQNNMPKVLTSTMLDLALKKYIRFETVDTNNKKEQIKVVVMRKDDIDLKNDEKEIYELLKRIQDDKDGFNMKELEKYAKKHYRVFLGKLDTIPDLVMEQMQKEERYNANEKEKGVLWMAKTALYIISIVFAGAIIGITGNIAVGLVLILTSAVCAMNSAIMATRLNGLTQKGVNEKEAWHGLKRYMEDYSMIDDREVPELVVWEKYLVYATAFGIADKVLKQLKVQYPELADGTYTNGVYLGIMYNNGLNMALISSINNSVTSAYNTGVSQRATEYDYSNTSSGGGFGGGFSGGGGFGGGGGGRRRSLKRRKNE